MNDHALDIMELLTDWFETIEEIELTHEDKSKLAEVAVSLGDLRGSALEMGFPETDFEEWLRIDLLDQWSCLMEDVEELEDEMNLPPVESFYNYAKGGEQRLYFQMLKRCSLASEMQSA